MNDVESHLQGQTLQDDLAGPSVLTTFEIPSVVK